MEKSVLTRSFIALAAAGCFTSVFAAPQAVSNTIQPVVTEADASLYAQAAEQQMQQWVKGLQTVLPSYHFTLNNFHSDGRISQGTVETRVSMGSGFDDREDIIFLTDVMIRHGLTVESPATGLAQIETVTRLSDHSIPELVELIGTEPLELSKGVVTLSGNLNTTFQSAGPFVRQLGDATFSLPSYSGHFESYNQAQLARLDFTVPTMTISGNNYYGEEKGVWLTGLHARLSNKPLQSGLWELSGDSEVTLDKLEYRSNGTPFFELNKLNYIEHARVDEKQLYHSDFAFTADNGHIASEVTNQAPIEIGKLRITGTIDNLHTGAYVQLSRMISQALDIEDGAELTNTVYDLLSYGPKIDINDISLTLNGHEGHMKFALGIQPFSTEERQLPIFLLLMEKMQVTASIDVPVQWLEIFLDKDTTDSLIEEGKNRGYINVNRDRITSNFSYEMGSILLNGKPIGDGLRGLF